MKPLEERLNDRLERAEWGIGRSGQHPGGFTLPVTEREHDSEVVELLRWLGACNRRTNSR